MSSGTKEYGKLTAAQFSELIEFVPKLLALITDVCELLADTPSESFDKFMCSPYGNYCQIYETSFSQHIATVSVVMNRHHDLHAMAISHDPQEEVLNVLRNLDKADDDRPLFEGFTESQALALIYSLGRSVTSMATYGRSISALLRRYATRRTMIPSSRLSEWTGRSSVAPPPCNSSPAPRCETTSRSSGDFAAL